MCRKINHRYRFVSVCYVREFRENIFSSDGQIILCKLCEVRVSHDKRYSIAQHIKTVKHLKSVNLCQAKKQNFQSLFINNTVQNKDPFSADLIYDQNKINFDYKI